MFLYPTVHQIFVFQFVYLNTAYAAQYEVCRFQLSFVKAFSVKAFSARNSKYRVPYTNKSLAVHHATFYILICISEHNVYSTYVKHFVRDASTWLSSVYLYYVYIIY